MCKTILSPNRLFSLRWLWPLETRLHFDSIILSKSSALNFDQLSSCFTLYCTEEPCAVIAQIGHCGLVHCFLTWKIIFCYSQFFQTLCECSLAPAPLFDVLKKKTKAKLLWLMSLKSEALNIKFNNSKMLWRCCCCYHTCLCQTLMTK